MTDAPKTPAKRGPRKKIAPVVEEPVAVAVEPLEEESEQLYVRNKGGVRIRMRPPRRRGEEYDYSLAPRGERGDAEPIDAQDLTWLQTNAANDGMYEVITHSEAMSYMTKQTHNQQRYHPALAALTDEFGNPVTGIGHNRQAVTQTITSVTVPEGDLNTLNQMPPGRPQ